MNKSEGLALALLTIALAGVSFANYLLFHAIAELLTIIVQVGVAVIALATYRLKSSPFIVALAVAAGFTAAFDLIHTLAYQGMNIFADKSANLATQTWLMGRYIQCSAVPAALVAARRGLAPAMLIAAYAAVSVLLLASVFIWSVFPAAFVAGTGQTAFKLASEYVISAVFLLSALWLGRATSLHPEVRRRLVAFLLLAALTDIIFTFYRDVYGFSNMLGHLVKILAYYSLAKAIIAITLSDPIKSLYYQLSQTNRDLSDKAGELNGLNRQLTAEIAERRRAEARLARLNEEYETVFNLVPAQIWVKDTANRYVRVNAEAARFVGLPAEEFVGKRVDELFPDQADQFYEDDLEVIRTRQPKLGIIEPLTVAGGKTHWLHTDKIPALDDNGNVRGVVAFVRDITEQRKWEEYLRYISFHDALTGLFNRAYFEEEMKRLDTRRAGAVGLIILDVDGLKFVNDTFGHDQGDLILKRTAAALRAAFRPDDVIARIGGDEFAVLLTDLTAADIEAACQRIREQAAANTKNAGPDAIALRISVGCALAEHAGRPMRDLFRAADNAMYRDKFQRRTGRPDLPLPDLRA